jgi:catechol 2,3-dioxygenase-like lactoylglutathione lyase family enzyme
MRNLRTFAIGLGLTLALACGLARAQTSEAAIDHVRVLVHDTQAARAQLIALGFKFDSEPMVYGEGSMHDGVELEDHFYLETISVADAAKLVRVRPWFIEFLKHREGIHSVGLIVPSARATADELKAKGVDASWFELRAKAGSDPVLLVTPRGGHLPDGSVFFLEYPAAVLKRIKSRKSVPQPNTAVGIAAVWILPASVPTASADLTAMGLRESAQKHLSGLGATSTEFETTVGKLLLVKPDNAEGPAGKFQQLHREGIMGLSVWVRDLKAAQAWTERAAAHPLPVYDGLFGRSILVPPDLMAGTWIEFVEPPSSPR